MADMIGHTSWEELQKEIGKPWYAYGSRSPHILFARMRSKHQPVFRLRMAWQRATRGHDDSMLWSLDHTLAKLTVTGCRYLREAAHGYPHEFSDPPIGHGGGWDAWEAILIKIETGFQAWLDEDGWFSDKPEKEAQFNEAMALYAEWFGGLWD